MELGTQTFRIVPSSTYLDPYTTSVNLKTASLLAFIGMLLLTIVDASYFFNFLTAYGHDAVALNTLLSSGVRLFANLTVTIFFFVFFRSQA